MTAGRALAYLTAIVILSTCCVLTLMCGILAGGAVGLMTGGAAGWAGGWGSRMPELRMQSPATPTPRAQATPRTTPTLPLTPRRTPQTAPQATPQTPRLPFTSDQPGARITAVDRDGPAEKAGLQVDDIVTEVGGIAVDENHTLTTLIRAKRPGEKVTLTVLRGTQTQKLEVTLGSRALDTGDVASLGVTYVTLAPAAPIN